MRSLSHCTEQGVVLLAALVFAASVAFSLPASAQDAAVEVLVRATPAGGRGEVVRGHPFYLLTESLENVRRVAEQEVPPPALEEFADSLDASPELIDWIKRTGVAEFRGEPFLRAMTKEDTMNVPEFQAAYIEANQPMVGLGFPRHKGKLKDRKDNPEKWEKATTEYVEKIRAYLEVHPESREGMERELLEMNPGPEWGKRQQAHQESVRRAMLRLIHGRYLAGEAETDLDGVARFSVAPGRYYLTNLWNAARVGNLQLSWQLPIEFPAAGSYRVELNNANALEERPSLP